MLRRHITKIVTYSRDEYSAIMLLFCNKMLLVDTSLKNARQLGTIMMHETVCYHSQLKLDCWTDRVNGYRMNSKQVEDTCYHTSNQIIALQLN